MLNQEHVFKKILKKVRTGYSDSKRSYAVDKVTFPANVKFSTIRDGAVVVVHDVPITKVGLQTYFDEAGKPERHFKTPEAIQGIRSDFGPMALTHPPLHFRDMTDEEVDNWMVGWTSDGRYDEEKQARIADCYFIVKKLEADNRGKELLERIKNGQSTDVSIGFYVDAVKESGVYNGLMYDVKQVGIDYDHLAVLVDEQGRFSFPDGVGIGADHADKTKEDKRMANEENDSAAADALAKQLADAEKAIQAAEAKAADAVKTAEEYKAKLDAIEKAEADKKASELKAKADALVEKLTTAGLSDAKELSEFVAKQDSAGLDFLGKFIGDSIVVKENTLHITRKESNDSTPAVDDIAAAREAERKAHDAVQKN